MGTYRLVSRATHTSGDFFRGHGSFRLRRLGLTICLATLATSQGAEAQKVVALVPLEAYGQAIRFNPLTHKIYAVDEPGNNVVEIDERTLKETVIALGPTTEKSLNGDIRIDPTRNRLYAINVSNSNVAVVDCSTYAVTFVPAGTHPTALEINSRTGKVYVVNTDSDNVTAIDGATLRTATIAVGRTPLGIAIDEKTNTIYVTNSHSDTISIINGKNNKARTVATGPYPNAVAVNSVSNRAYVGNLQADTITVIHGRSARTKTIKVSPYPFCIVVNQRTNKIYLNHQALQAITVIDGRTNAVAIIGSGIIPAGAPDGLAVDELQNKIYVGEWATRVAIIDGATDATTTLPNPGGNTHRIVADPIANAFYTLNMTDNINHKPLSSVTIFAGP
jgi:YVTN family beta-propeller protein